MLCELDYQLCLSSIRVSKLKKARTHGNGLVSHDAGYLLALFSYELILTRRKTL